MSSPSPVGDILAAFAGSAVFWLTVAGMAIRALRVDFVKLESTFKLFYERADRITFSAARLSSYATVRVLEALYGKTLHRLLFAAGVPVLALNIYVGALLYADWIGHRSQIVSNANLIVSTIDPEYYAIRRNPESTKELVRALEDIGTADDDEATKVNEARLMEIHKRFKDRLDNYIYSNHAEHEFALLNLFGNSEEDLTMSLEKGSVFMDLSAFILGAVIVTSLIDLIAISATKTLVQHFLQKHWGSILISISIITSCFLISAWDYECLLRAQYPPAFTVTFWLLINAAIVLVPVGLVYGMSKGWFIADLDDEWFIFPLFIWGMSLTFIFLWSISNGRSFISWLRFPIRPIGQLFTLFGHNSSHTSVMVAATALFPAACVVSIVATIFIIKIVVVTLKTYLLGQVYGASVLSGSTYFLGFLVTIITSSALVIALIHLL